MTEIMCRLPRHCGHFRTCSPNTLLSSSAEGIYLWPYCSGSELPDSSELTEEEAAACGSFLITRCGTTSSRNGEAGASTPCYVT